METVKCRFCKKIIPKAQAYKVSAQTYYCDEECYKKQMDKNKYKSPRKKSDGTENLRRKLTDYIQELYINQGYDKHDIDWKLITAQIKNFMKDDSSITYGGIKYTLWYLVNIEDKNLFDSDNFNGSILNLVPTCYMKAKKYCEDMIKLKKEIEDFQFEDKVVTIHKSFDNIKKRKDLTFD